MVWEMLFRQDKPGCKAEREQRTPARPVMWDRLSASLTFHQEKIDSGKINEPLRAPPLSRKLSWA